MPPTREEILKQLREASAKRDAIPEDQRTELKRPERFIGEAIGVDDKGEFFPEDAAKPDDEKKEDA